MFFRHALVHECSTLNYSYLGYSQYRFLYSFASPFPNVAIKRFVAKPSIASM